MSATDPLGIGAIRVHRELQARRYANPTPSQWPQVPLLVALGPALIAVLFVTLRAFTSMSDGLILLVVVASALGPVLILLLVLRGLLADRPARADQRRAARSIEGNLPDFCASLAAAWNGEVDVDESLRPTIAFLDRNGMLAVPNLVLCRLFGGPERRHRVEGTVDGRPVAAIVVVGEPRSGRFVLETAISRTALGPHLFVLLPGVTTAPTAPLDGFEAFGAGEDLTLVRAIVSLPDATALTDLIRSIGPRSVAGPLGDAAAPPTFRSSQAATAAFFDGLATGDAAASLAAIDPQLFLRDDLMMTADGLRSWAESWGLLGQRPAHLDGGWENRSTVEALVRFEPPSGGRTIETQAYAGTDGCYRITCVSEGDRVVGWDDRTLDTPHL